MSPIDTIISCDDCGRRLNEEGQSEQFFYGTIQIETGLPDKRIKKKSRFIILCGFCLKNHPELLKLSSELK